MPRPETEGCRIAAMQRMNRFMTGRNTTSEEEPRLDAPLVYPDGASANRWMVSPPPDRASVAPQAFTGPNARQAALEFAHERYGSARYFSA